jgi:UDP-N-acetylmuramate dehydrogenase
MLGDIRGAVRFKESLAFHTSLRCGGPADIFVLPQDVEDIRKALAYAERERMPAIVLGGGNNVLVRDGGLRGIVIKLHGRLGRWEFVGDEVTVGAGASLPAILRTAASRGLGGLECLAGTPATVGGALSTSTPRGVIGDFVSEVFFLHADGTLGLLRPSPGTFAYDALMLPPGAVLVGARFRLQRKPARQVGAELDARLRHVRTTQPLSLASGYIWRQPDGQDAARLIAAAGLRGKSIGRAEISGKHAGFIVNRGGATAAEILALMDMARERVHAQHGVLLEPGIRVIGEDAGVKAAPVRQRKPGRPPASRHLVVAASPA